MKDRNYKVIGYFSYLSPLEVFCSDGNSCIIAGSISSMKKYLQEKGIPDGKKSVIKKTRFGEILYGIKKGAAYAFDEISYEKFYPIALKEKLPVQKANFKEIKSKGYRFITVQPIFGKITLKLS
jgi:hypothetical protein